MNSKVTDTLDPVVARTRESRDALARRCDYDLDRMVELFRSMQAQHPERVRSPERSPDAGAIRAGGQARRH